MSVIAIRCGCGETHRLLTTPILASMWVKPPARSTDCRLLNAKPVPQPVDPECAEVQDQAAGNELAAAFG